MIADIEVNKNEVIVDWSAVKGECEDLCLVPKTIEGRAKVGLRL